MGDRTNPIKFGPEWLRNLASEPSSSGTGSSSINSPPTNSSLNSSTNTMNQTSSRPTTSTSSGTPTSTAPRILLAKLRYGREEMLALYDRETAEAPEQLKVIDLLYQPRGKPPYALNNTFEDEPNDTHRSAPPIGSMASGDRYMLTRGRGSSSDGRGRGTLGNVDNRPVRGRSGFNRGVTGRGGLGNWHTGTQRSPYSGNADDDPSQTRSWNTATGSSSNNATVTRTNNEQSEWARNKARPNNTNWRQQQHNRDGWEEWRTTNTRGQDKWEWWDTNNKDKPWNSNRRTWVGGDNSEDALPEWAVENAEACGGTFDSSGAFHGYSNDDSNLPKSQDASYPLSRSHTHGAFARSKTADEGSQEWWASEKANKLLPKRVCFAPEAQIQFRRRGLKEMPATSKPSTSSVGTNVTTTATVDKSSNDNATPATPPADPKVGANSKEDKSNEKDNREKQGSPPKTLDPEEKDTDQEKGKNPFHTKYHDNKSYENKAYENKPYESKAYENKRNDNNNDEPKDGKGNFKSVMIPSNNILRQKHQNIGIPTNETVKRQSTALSKLLEIEKNHAQPTKKFENDEDAQKDSETNKLVEDILEMNLEDDLPSSMANTGLPMRMNSTHVNPAMGMASQNPIVSSSIHSPGMQNNLLQPISITSNMLNTSLGLPLGPGANLGLPMHLPQPSMSNLGLSGSNILPSGLQGLAANMQPISRHPSSMQTGGSSLQGGNMSGGMQTSLQNNMQNPMPVIPGVMQGAMQGTLTGIQTAMQSGIQTIMQTALQSAMPNMMQNPLQSGMQNHMQSGMQNQMQSGMQVPVMQSGVQNSSMSQQHNHNVQSGGPAFQSNSAMSTSNVGNNSLFLGQGSNNPIQNSNDMPNHGGQPVYALHGLPSASHGAYNTSLFNNMMNPGSHSMSLGLNMSSFLSLADKWYYEDPEKNIQGPFSSKEMYNWSEAGFFPEHFMVRRACDNGMRLLKSYGPKPFTQIGILPPLGFDLPETIMTPQQQTQQAPTTPQPGLGLDVMNQMVHNKMNNNNLLLVPNIPNVHRNNGGMPNPLQFRPQGPRSPMFGQPPQPMVESLWGQPSQPPDMIWVQQGMNNPRPINNNTVFYWRRDPSAISSNALLPEDITKEMKTEDQILAQLRSQSNPASSQGMTFGEDQIKKLDEPFDIPLPPNPTPNLDELQKLIQKDTITGKDAADTEQKQDKVNKQEQAEKQAQNKAVDNKAVKQTNKTETEKTKAKDNGNSKIKNKKTKDDKKEEVEVKKDSEPKMEKRSQEPSPTKNKKEEKISKKDIEKEKKEWIKEGFTIVKGTEKNKDNKKKTDEAKAAEELERKKKEEERFALEEEKKRRQQMEVMKQQQEMQQQQSRQVAELSIKKAPWSAVANPVALAPGREGLSLAEIQRLEREKKLEQMKEQQHMMQLIAQQQAMAAAREQEMQAGLGWAKKKVTNSPPGQSLTEIQTETRKQTAAAAAASVPREEVQPTPPPPVNNTPWATTVHNGGFWDTQPNQPAKPEKAPEPPKPVEVKPKKKVTVVTPPKKENSPSAEFEAWCTGMLSAWQEANIDVPTFVAFLKDIESPYEVKDYVKCYLGDTKEASEFARQFLERRSRLLRVGTVTPSDDLCSPAIAINPRTNSGSDYQEVKGKGKKAKKNKMLKVDARILGFSVTASEDRINVGDIDTV